MRIALISYQYPTVTPGGIGTYVALTAKTFAQLGHSVVVFTSGEDGIQEVDGFLKVSVSAHPWDFRTLIVEPFTRLHQEQRFDIIEGPDYQADAAGIQTKYPDTPLVIRLHCPSKLGWKANIMGMGIRKRTLRNLAKAAQDYLPSHFQRKWSDSMERQHCLSADHLLAPSQFMADTIAQAWNIPRHRIEVLPLAVSNNWPEPAFSKSAEVSTVLYFGRLSTGKGVHLLAQAMQRVMARCPKTEIIFAGQDGESPLPGLSMSGYIERKLRPHLSRVTILPSVPHDKISTLIQQSTVCAFPSLFESFGLTCVEAIMTGRPVIASERGGMSEILESGKLGTLVNPYNIDKLAEAILQVTQDYDRSLETARLAYNTVRTKYDAVSITRRHLTIYESVLASRAS